MSEKKFEKLIIDMGYDYSEIKALINNPVCKKEFPEKEQMYLAIIMSLEFLHSFGFNNDEILKIVKKVPQLFALNIETLDGKLVYLSEKLGYTRENIKNMISRVPLLFVLNQERISQNVIDIMNLGYTKEEVKDITVECPSLFLFNIDYIREKDNFYRSIGIERVFVKSVKSIIYSIEFVYARYSFLKSIGIDINEKNWELLFETGFLRSYGKTNEQLMSEYPYPRDSFKKKN